MSHKLPMLLYVHGFNSSPGSHKASLLVRYCQTHYPDIRVVVPQLPCFPVDIAHLLSSLVEQYQHDYHIGLVGSSLGGYFSMWLNARYALKAVLVNPAIRPDELLLDYLGEQENPYTHERYLLAAHHITELKALDIQTIESPQQFLLLQQTGDEILDYRLAVEKLHGARQIVEEGGDHSFIGFERYRDTILKFLELS